MVHPEPREATPEIHRRIHRLRLSTNNIFLGPYYAVSPISPLSWAALFCAVGLFWLDLNYSATMSPGRLSLCRPGLEA